MVAIRRKDGLCIELSRVGCVCPQRRAFISSRCYCNRFQCTYFTRGWAAVHSKRAEPRSVLSSHKWRSQVLPASHTFNPLRTPYYAIKPNCSPLGWQQAGNSWRRRGSNYGLEMPALILTIAGLVTQALRELKKMLPKHFTTHQHERSC